LELEKGGGKAPAALEKHKNLVRPSSRGGAKPCGNYGKTFLQEGDVSMKKKRKI